MTFHINNLKLLTKNVPDLLHLSPHATILIIIFQNVLSNFLTYSGVIVTQITLCELIHILCQKPPKH